MKRCPECRRDYYDDTLLYCLDDGTALLDGPASGSAAFDGPATAILHNPTRLAMHPDPDTEYLSDGLAESLIYRLSQIPDLKVSPRSSVFRYKGQDADAENYQALYGK
jgi:hypothetical protein